MRVSVYIPLFHGVGPRAHRLANGRDVTQTGWFLSRRVIISSRVVHEEFLVRKVTLEKFILRLLPS
jgi:hypothetical protein